VFDVRPKTDPNPLAASQKKPAGPPAPPPPPPAAAKTAKAPAPPGPDGKPAASPADQHDAVGHFAEGAGPSEHGGGAPEHKEVDAKAIAGSMDKMMGAVRVGFDKPEQILDALRGKDAADIAAMKEEFKRRMGPDADMEAWVLKQQGATNKPANVTEAQALLAGDQVEAAAFGLDNAASGKKPDGAKLMNILSGIKDEEVRKKVLAKYGEMNPEQPLADVIEKMKGADKDKANALLAGDFATAKAVDMDVARGSKADGILGKLSGLRVNEEEKEKITSVVRGAESPEERQQILMAYAKRRGGPCKTPEEAAEFFKKDAEKFTKDGADRDLFNAVADGNEAGAAAASIEKAQKAGNLDAVVKEMESPIDDKLPKEERDKQLAEHRKKMGEIEKTWAEKYGEKDKDGKPSGDPPKEQFSDMLQKAAGAGSLAKGASSPETLRMQTVADEGQMDRRTMVAYARLTKKPDLIAKAMEGLDANQINEITKDAPGGDDVVAAIYDSAKGRKRKDLLRDAMFGETPSNAGDALEKAEALHDEERGKGAGLLHGVVDKLSDKDEQMDEVSRRVSDLRKKHDAGGLSPEEEAEAKQLSVSMEGTAKGYRADEDTTAKAVTTPIKLGAGLALKPLLGPLAAPVVKGMSAAVNAMLTGEFSGDDIRGVGSSAAGQLVGALGGSGLVGTLAQHAVELGTAKEITGRDIVKRTLGVAAGAGADALGEGAGDLAKEHMGHVTDNELVKMAAEKGASWAGGKAADKAGEHATDKIATKMYGVETEAKEEEEAGGGEAAEKKKPKASPVNAQPGASAGTVPDKRKAEEEVAELQAKQQHAQAASAEKSFAK
jgi:hypothetical protein